MEQLFQKIRYNITDVGIATGSSQKTQLLVHIAGLIIIGVMQVSEGKPPIKVESRFYLIKLAFVAMIIFTVLGFISSYMKIENSTLWFDLAKITLGFMFGNGVSIGLTR